MQARRRDGENTALAPMQRCGGSTLRSMLWHPRMPDDHHCAEAQRRNEVVGE